MNPPPAVIVELIVAAPIDIVWNALRDRAAIAQWFGWNHPGLPEEIEQIFQTHAVADDAARRLVINTDELSLEAHGGRTIVRVTRAAPVRGTWDDIYDEIAEGWRTFIHQLRFMLERHAKAPRRTIYLSGRARSEGARPAELLGLPQLANTRVGDAFELHAAVGDRLSGHVWFRSRWQIGLCVHEFGDGLLVATLRPETDKSPFGGGMCVLTLYGFDQARHEALTAKWRAWFDANFDKVEVQT